jgi:co-chaperonin GroES (HSP10)
MGDRILVKIDPESKVTASGLLVKPDDAHESIVQTGVVVDVGPGRWAEEKNVRIPVGVEPGEGVLFVKFTATSTKTAQSLQAHLDKDEALLQPNDILLAYDRKNPPAFA